MNKLLTFIKNRKIEIIIGIGGVATLLSFVFKNEHIFLLRNCFFIHWFNFCWDESLFARER